MRRLSAQLNKQERVVATGHLPDPSDVGVVAAGCVERTRELVGLRVVHQHDTGAVRKRFARRFDGEIARSNVAKIDTA